MKKVTALFLCVILAACAFPVSAFADDGVPDFFINNAERNYNESFTIDCGEGTASFNPETKTLTLNNATINVTSESGIYSGNDLKIVLEGTNKIDAGGYNGITVNGDSFEISGDGSLEITDIGENWGGIFAKNTKVNGGTITVRGGRFAVSADGDLIIDGGNITATGGAENNLSGVFVTGDMTVEKGKISGTGTSIGILISGGLTANGGEIIGQGIGTNGTGIYSGLNITVNGGKITATGKTGINARKLFVNGGDISATGKSLGILMAIAPGDIENADENATLQELQAMIFNMTGGSITAEGTGEDGKAMSMLPDTADYKGFKWRSAKTAAYSKEALTEALLNERYFEIREEAPFVYRPSAVVHQIGGAENPAVFGAENPAASGADSSTASGEENPNTGADFASIICGVAVLALAGAAMLKSKKH